MTTRHSVLAVLAVLLAAMLSLGIMVGMAEPAAGFTGPVAPEVETTEPTFQPSEAVGFAEGDFRGGPVEAMDAPMELPGDPERVGEAASATHGTIRGEVALSAPIAPEVRRVTVRLQENRNWDGTGEPPFSRTMGITVDRSTPRFEFTGVPVSDHGYVVEAFAPGANGSASHTQLTSNEPRAHVRLTLTEPVPFTVMLRDQFQNPVTETPVLLQPEGQPLGRPAKHGTTNNYGTVRLDGVLAGNYTVRVGDAGNLLVDPVAVEVQRPGVTVLESKEINHQHKVVQVPRGVPLTVMVTERNGWAIADANVEVLQINTRQLMERTAPSGQDGRARFPHMPAGDFRVNIHKPGYQRIARTLNIGENDQDAVLDIVLVRLR